MARASSVSFMPVLCRMSVIAENRGGVMDHGSMASRKS